MIKMRKRKCSNDGGINNVYTVETIYKKKIRNNKEPLYFIKWKDWDDKYNTWEPLSNILDHSLIETFEEEIREKRKEAKKKKIDWGKVDYESDVKSESHDEVDTLPGQKLINISCKEDDNKCELTSEELISRPKICIKIPKSRLHPPHSSSIVNSLSNDQNSSEIEMTRYVPSQSEDDQSYMSRLSPLYLPQDINLNKLTKDESPHQIIIKSPKKEELGNLSQKHSSHSRKPRKLLSINEYSAAIKMKKKHHKKSKHGKHRSERRRFHSVENFHRPMPSVTVKISSILETPKKLSVEEKPILSLAGWPKSRFGQPVLQEMESKLERKFQLNAQTIVTDVTVNGLCVTVKEMSYEDFLNDSYPRYQLIRVPRNSDWTDRYLGESDDDKQENESHVTDTDDCVRIIERNNDDEMLSKQRLLDRFEERIIPGLRPPSRPRSVDSYRNIMDKTMYGINRPHFNESLTPNRTTGEESCTTENIISNEHRSVNTPLNVVIDECEEVDVVGGIESENSYMSSLQSTRTTVTTQLRQARLTNQIPVNSIIQSLWHSYSYNSPITMPPLQAAPWVQSSGEQSFQLSPQSTDHSQYLSRSSSIDPSLLKYSQSVPLNYYPQSSALLSNLYLSNITDETPIDLSLK